MKPQITQISPIWKKQIGAKSSEMKSFHLRVRLDADTNRLLQDVVQKSGGTRSEIVREALRRHLLIFQLEQIRQRVMPSAEARGYLSDNDIFRRVS